MMEDPIMQKTNFRPMVPFALASAVIMAPMLAYGQAAQQSTQPPAAQTPGTAAPGTTTPGTTTPGTTTGQTTTPGTTTPQTTTPQQPTTPPGVSPGQPAPPSPGLSPGMTPGGAVGEMPDRTTGTDRQTQVPGGAQPVAPGDRGGTITTTPPAGTTGTVGAPTTTQPTMTQPTTTQPAATFPPGSAVMARPRMSQIIGSNVYNEENNSIGSVDDIILVPPTGAGHEGPIAVLQVGGFLGIGGRLVAVPLGDVQWNPDRERLLLPGATTDSLRNQPEFRYDTIRPR